MAEQASSAGDLARGVVAGFTEPPAPAPAASEPPAPVEPRPVYPFSTKISGLSDTQAAAKEYCDGIKGALARDMNNLALRESYSKAMQHVYNGAPCPDHIYQRMGQDVPGQAPDTSREHDSLSNTLAGHFAPLQDVEGLVSHGVIVGLPRAAATEAAKFCQDAQLPEFVSKGVVDRLVKHVEAGWGTGELSDADHAELSAARAHALGDKAEAEITLARKYLHSVGGDKLLARVDASGSLGYDPRLILQFSMMARARGIS